jgi:hypothetical protein
MKVDRQLVKTLAFRRPGNIGCEYRCCRQLTDPVFRRDLPNGYRADEHRVVVIGDTRPRIPR